jgi:putative transcriptional regulator
MFGRSWQDIPRSIGFDALNELGLPYCRYAGGRLAAAKPSAKTSRAWQKQSWAGNRLPDERLESYKTCAQSQEENMQFLQGRFLVAAPQQLDPNFAQAVILVVKHSDQGAFGLIINCPRSQSEGVLCQSKAGRSNDKRANRYFGGPVAGPLMALHCHPALGEVEVLPGLFFSGGKENVLAVMHQSQPPCRIFTGYSGWGPGQLDNEIGQGVWRTTEANVERVFSHSNRLWRDLHGEAPRKKSRTIFHLRTCLSAFAAGARCQKLAMPRRFAEAWLATACKTAASPAR